MGYVGRDIGGSVNRQTVRHDSCLCEGLHLLCLVKITLQDMSR